MNETISLLWPENCPREEFILDDQTIADLDLKTTVSLFSPRKSVQEVLLKQVSSLTTNPDVISYRQAVLADLVHNEALRETMNRLLPYMDTMNLYGRQHKNSTSPIHILTCKIGELESYTECIGKLSQAFHSSSEPESRAFQKLKKLVHVMAEEESFKKLHEELPKLKSKIRGIKSMTIGVNLNSDYIPVGATILSINSEEFRESTLLKSLMNKRTEYSGIAPLHTPPKKTAKLDRASTVLSPEEFGWAVDPMLIPLFNDLSKLLQKSSSAILKGLKQFNDLQTGFLAGLTEELTFFLGAAHMVLTMKEAGMEFCMPEVRKMSEKTCMITDFYNVNLARSFYDKARALFTSRPVPTDVSFKKGARTAILTGPNRGGKTVFIQGLTVAQVLFQTGLFVPGTKAAMSPVDGIFTHYQIEERPDENKGRFGEEASRLNAIFQKATGSSMIIMNESFSSTNAGESLYLAEDVLRIIQKMDGWVVFATHLHELAENIDKYNRDSENKMISLVCQIEESEKEGSVTRTYKVIQGPPMGQSYARELAAHYGISFDQLNENLNKRGVFTSRLTV